MARFYDNRAETAEGKFTKDELVEKFKKYRYGDGLTRDEAIQKVYSELPEKTRGDFDKAFGTHKGRYYEDIAYDKRKQETNFNPGDQIIAKSDSGQSEGRIIRKVPQKELDGLGWYLNPDAPLGYYEIEENPTFGEEPAKRIVWAHKLNRKK